LSWLIVSLVGWLVVGWLVVGWLVAWLVGRVAPCLIDPSELTDC